MRIEIPEGAVAADVVVNDPALPSKSGVGISYPGPSPVATEAARSTSGWGGCPMSSTIVATFLLSVLPWSASMPQQDSLPSLLGSVRSDGLARIPDGGCGRGPPGDSDASVEGRTDGATGLTVFSPEGLS